MCKNYAIAFSMHLLAGIIMIMILTRTSHAVAIDSLDLHTTLVRQ